MAVRALCKATRKGVGVTQSSSAGSDLDAPASGAQRRKAAAVAVDAIGVGSDDVVGGAAADHIALATALVRESPAALAAISIMLWHRPHTGTCAGGVWTQGPLSPRACTRIGAPRGRGGTYRASSAWHARNAASRRTRVAGSVSGVSWRW